MIITRTLQHYIILSCLINFSLFHYFPSNKEIRDFRFDSNEEIFKDLKNPNRANSRLFNPPLTLANFDPTIDFKLHPKSRIKEEPKSITSTQSTGTFPVKKNATWRYNDKGIDLGTTWNGTTYDHSSWKSGSAVLGYGDPVATTISYGASSTNKIITYYFRHDFNVPDASIYQNLIFNIRRDDGAVVYLNGVEQFRTNMPTGAITFKSVSQTFVGGGNETTYYTFKVPSTHLKSGFNVIAVSLHQHEPASSDLSFDMEVIGELKPAPVSTTGTFPVKKNATWRYNDKGIDLGISWNGTTYDHSSWKSGSAVLGYGDPVATTISYGASSTNKIITYYFRHDFNVPDASIYQNLIFNIRRDDGAVVYLNGVEQFRTNMPTGAITFKSVSQTFVGGGNETTYYTFKVPSTHLKSGFNVIAVSLHQHEPASSDLSFDMEVIGELKPAPVSTTGTFPVKKNATWRYNDKGLDLGTSWKGTTYDHSSWKSGSAVFGYGDPVATPISYGASSTNKIITYYFRQDFNVPDASIYQNLIFNIRRDDGAVVYLNGVEQFRTNMPTGAITFKSVSQTFVGGGNETTYYTFKVPSTHLKSGFNVIAVSLHQHEPASSDLSFDMEVTGELKPAPVSTTGTFPVKKNATWRYNDKGLDLGTSWKGTTYDHSSWKSGSAVLGYGDPVATTISYGASSTNKIITYYFRQDFNVPDASIYQNLIFNIRRDDGAVVYLNGVEQFRTNMPTGAITFKSVSQTFVGGGNETTYYTFKVPSTHLKSGFNVIAVSLHQHEPTSSDLSFDMEVTGEQVSTLSSNCPPDKIGCFTSIKPSAQSEIFVFPDSHTFQQIAKSGVTQYTSGGTGTMPVGNDFTAYVAKSGSSKEGILSVNHENHPGGVSILNLKLNEQKMLWEVNGVHQMSFSSVAGTTRNCSGGVTPWGTVITSEENYATVDANKDGYKDYGWNVEFDPVSGKVRDYNGDGKPDKLWAMGRMKHENIAVGKDGITVYQGEDGGTSCVYKFKANSPGNVSSGTLYVLKRNPSNLTLGEWIKVPNSTKSDRNNTSSIAGSLGGTNWSNVEDVEWGPDGKIYFTSKVTGTIWRFKDNGTNVSEIEPWVTNKQYAIKHKAGTQMENFGVGIDNLVFDGDGNLWALQDGDRHHIWVIKPNHTPTSPKIELFATAPAGSEPTGLTFTPDYKYGFFSLQHYSGSNTQTQLDASGTAVKHNASSTIVFARKEHLGNSSSLYAARLASTSHEIEPTDSKDPINFGVFPNPFRTSIQVNYSLKEESPISIELLTLEGAVIKKLVNESPIPGEQYIEMDDIGFLNQGIYLLRISTNDQVFTKRLFHLKDQ